MTQGCLSLIVQCPPTNTLAPTSPHFLDNFLDELEKSDTFTLSADQVKSNTLEDITLEIKEEPSFLLPLLPASVPAKPPSSLLPFSSSGETSAATQISEATPHQDTRKIIQNKFTDLTKMERGLTNSIKVPEILGDKFVTSAHTSVGPLPQTLPVIGEEDEEIYEGVLSGNLRGPESLSLDGLWCSHDGSEVAPSLHIEEEDEERKPDDLNYLVANLSEPKILKEDSNAAKSSNEVFYFCLTPQELTKPATVT